jgi:hypothetical protein
VPLQGRQPSARSLERVVSIAQRRTVREVTLALASSGRSSASCGIASPTRRACSRAATVSPSRSSSSGMNRVASYPGHHGAPAAAIPKPTVSWRSSICKRRGDRGGAPGITGVRRGGRGRGGDGLLRRPLDFPVLRLASLPRAGGAHFPGSLARFGEDEEQGEGDYQGEAGRDVDEREQEDQQVGDGP